MSDAYDLNGVHGAEAYRSLPQGVRLRLNDGAVGTIIENPGDGAYVLLSVDECPEQPERVGTEELVYFLDVEGVIA